MAGARTLPFRAIDTLKSPQELVEPKQSPVLHASPLVQVSPSLHARPSALALAAHFLPGSSQVASLQLSARLEQSVGPPATQPPLPSQPSPLVQNLPSSQGTPAALALGAHW